MPIIYDHNDFAETRTATEEEMNLKWIGTRHPKRDGKILDRYKENQEVLSAKKEPILTNKNPIEHANKNNPVLSQKETNTDVKSIDAIELARQNEMLLKLIKIFDLIDVPKVKDKKQIAKPKTEITQRKMF